MTGSPAAILSAQRDEEPGIELMGVRSSFVPTTPTCPEQPNNMPSPTVTSPQVAVNDIGSSEDFLAAIDKTIKYFNDGDIVEGTIVKVDRDEVLLDIGYKTEGVIPSRELSIKHDVDPNEVVSVGDEVEALVLTKEDKEGRLILSKKRAQYERAWGTIEALKEKDEAVKGTVIEVVKGGLILDIGLRGFLPASLVEMRRVRDLQPYIGKEIEAKIIELDKNRNNVVLSRRAWLEQTQSEVRSEFLNQLQKGAIRKGVVSSIVNFGAFVDLGGVDGLVHVSELSWKHIDHPSEVVQVGDEVTVEVLDVDMDRERVSLSLKATQEDPWRHFARTHAIGQIVPGKVTKLVPFGAFVRVEEGIEGLVHISELAERHVEVPDQVVAVGDDAMVKVIDIDLERRRISLSLKQANEDYTEEFDPAKYGMADSYDEQGNYIFPEGFDPETNEWLDGFDTQRAEWEARYAEAERRHKMHTTQMEKFAAADDAAAAERPQANGSSGEEPPAAAHWPATRSSPRCGRSSPVAPSPLRMLRIGLTGGIGAGKSAVSATFSQCGGVVVDGDVIAREVVEPGTEGLAALVDAFGEDILLPDGALNRPALAAKAFSSDETRATLNGIVHPLVGKRRAELIAAVPEDSVVVEDIPLLVESGMAPLFPLVVVVYADAEVRVARLVEHRAMAEDDARARIAAQADDEQRRAVADVWLDNSSTPEALAERAREVWDRRIMPFAANLSAGRVVRPPVRLVPADPAWPDQTARIIARLKAACGPKALRVDHIGSTAVPGLNAKDAIDVQVTVESLTVADELAAALRSAGYPRIDDVSSDVAKLDARSGDSALWHKRLHASADPGRPTFVHLRVSGWPNQQFALLFVDWLKANPEVRDEYLAVKRRAEQAASPDGDIERYLAVKEPWFLEAYQRAWDWADRSDWRP